MSAWERPEYHNYYSHIRLPLWHIRLNGFVYSCRPDDGLFFSGRTTKLSLVRSRIRRQLMQLHRSQRSNSGQRNVELHTLRCMIQATRHNPAAATNVVKQTASADTKQNE